MNRTTRRIPSVAAAAGIVSLATALPGTAKPEWTEPAGLVEDAPPPPDIVEVLVEVPVDDDAWEYAQVGFGALAGGTAVGAAALALRRREQHAIRPA